MGETDFPHTPADAAQERVPPTVSRVKPRPWTWDAVLCVVFLVCAGVYGGLYCWNWDGPRQLYQDKWGPAAMFALGHGLHDTFWKGSRESQHFIKGERDDLPPGALPDEPRLAGLTDFHLLHRYSLYCIGLTWRVFGIRWSMLAIPEGIFFGVSMALAYLLFRVAMPRLVAVLMTTLLTLSPVALHVLPQYRDYSKVPFAMAAFLLIAVLVCRPMSWRRTALLAALLGAVLGIGNGFRQEFVLYCLGSVLMATLFLPGRPRETWKHRAAAGILIPVLFALTSWPILSQAPRDSNDYHIAEGLTKPFDDDLQLTGPYQLGNLYSDEYVHSIISSFGERKGVTRVVAFPSGAGEWVGKRYVLEVFRVFPYDMCLRGLRTISHITTASPFCLSEHAGPAFDSSPHIETLFQWRWRVLGWSTWLGLWPAVALILLLSACRLRWGLAMAFALLFFCGMICLQFHHRHYVHLEVFYWWILGLMLTCVWRVGHGLATRRAGALPSRGAIRAALVRMGITALLLTVLLGGPALGALALQSHNAGALFRRYAETPLRPLTVNRVEGPETQFVVEDLFDTPPTETEVTLGVQTRVLNVEIEPAPTAFPLVVRYQADHMANDFSHTYWVQPRWPGETGPRQLYLPIYNTSRKYFGHGQRSFRAISVLSFDAVNIRAIRALESIDHFTLLPILELPQNWQTVAPRMHFASGNGLLQERIYRSAARNLYPEGDFEIWPPALESPQGVVFPKTASAAAAETTQPARGRRAIRQQWTTSDASLSPLEQLRGEVEHLEAGQTYEIMLDAWNQGREPVYVRAWQLMRLPDGRRELALLGNQIVTVPPGEGYQTHRGIVRLLPVPHPFSVLFTTAYGGSDPNGTTVLWDNWRVLRYSPS